MVIMFLSIQVIFYDVGNIADWLAVIGAIEALFYALHLVRKDSKAKREINVGLRTILNFGYLLHCSFLNFFTVISIF